MDSQRQIEQMKQFILSEAKEKAEEIKTKAANEAYAWKNENSKKQKEEIDRRCQKEMELHKIGKRVENAQKLKQQRDKILGARLGAMDGLKDEAVKALKNLTKQSEYKKLFADLLRQATETVVGEDGSATVIVRCRKDDKALAEANTSVLHGVTVNVSSDFLNDDNIGGCEVRSSNGKIVCNNTLSHRLECCMEEVMPIMRNGLFS